MLSHFCFQTCRNISCSEPSFAFTVPKPLRFSNYVTLPRSQGIRISQDGFSGSRVGVVKPNVTWSVQKPQAMQTITISRQQHPLPPGPCTARGLSGSWSQLGLSQTRLTRFKTFLPLLPPVAAVQHRNADLIDPEQSPKSQPQHFAVHPQHSHYSERGICALLVPRFLSLGLSLP